MIFGKKENLDLRDWQTFLDEERSRSHTTFLSPRRGSSSRNSPAGFLIFKQKKKFRMDKSATLPPKLMSSAESPIAPPERSASGPEKAWSDDELGNVDEDRGAHDEVIELAEMTEDEGGSTETRRHRTDSTAVNSPSMTAAPSFPAPKTATSPPVIPSISISPHRSEGSAIVLSPHREQLSKSQEKTAKSEPLADSQTSKLSPKSQKERLRRISLSDSQVVFFERWKRDLAKEQEKVDEVEALNSKAPTTKERKSYEMTDANTLRKLLIQRDREVASLRRIVEEFRRRDLKAQARERELREELKAERERAERMQQRESVLKDLIREKVEEQRKLKRERDREHKTKDEDAIGLTKRRDTHSGILTNGPGLNKKNEKTQKKKEKKKGSMIKFQKEASNNKDREKERGRSRERKEAPIEVDGAGGDDQEELGQDPEKGGTWGKARGREVKLFRHLRSKSSGEVPTASVVKEHGASHKG